MHREGDGAPDGAPEQAPEIAGVDPRLIAGLVARGVTRPYAHQAEAISALARGNDVVIATATASGKSLCYQVPILDAALRDPDARALLLFPTKALARDQLVALRELAGPLGVGSGTYDGDTPPDERRATRARAHVVATNPDMLHRAILPHHDRWSALLASLRYVVLDEMHTYRGVFGAHVAHVLRRLLRLCAYYGAAPRIVGCSATIANPRELMAALTARPEAEISLVDHDTAPRGPRSFVLLNPAVVDATTGVRRDYLKVSRRVTGLFRRAGVRTLAFCRTRKAVELLTRYLREDEAARGGGSGADAPADGPVDPAARARAERVIRGYRGGYLPEHRRDVERALREGEAHVVATTNALELGMDIGGLDGVVLAGYPGTRAATWQRAGRAGRKGEASVIAMVLSSRPLDQCLAATPEFLFGRPPEHARVDPDNPEVLVPHLRCAVHELPVRIEAGRADPGYLGVDNEDLRVALDYLVEVGALHRERGERGEQIIAPSGTSATPSIVDTYVSVGPAFPSDAIDLRGGLEENFEVIELRPGDAGHGRVLAEVDFADGPLYLHPGAIYPLEGQTFEVRELDWEGRKAYVRAVAAQYYTEAICELRVRVLEVSRRAPTRGAGYGQVVRAVPAFKKLRFRTHENIGFGPVNVPELDLQTSIAWWIPSSELLARLGDPARRADAVLGAAHALHHSGAMVCMCDLRDLGCAVGSAAAIGDGGSPGAWAVSTGHRGIDLEREAGGCPAIYLYDALPGGAGLSPQLSELGADFIDRAAAIVRGCGCARGCPTCVGAEQRPGPGDWGAGAEGEGSTSSLREDVLALLDDLRAP